MGQFNDDISYLGLARSLAQGLPYQDLYEWGAPAQVRFPPGYPLALLPLQACLPDQLWLVRLESLLFSLLALWLFAGICRQLKLGEAVWMLAANPLWAFYSTAVMSEALFSLLVLRYLQILEQDLPRRRLLILGMASALCYYVRAVGLALVPATLIWRRRRPWREHLWFLAGFWLAAGPEALVTVATGYSGEFHGSLTDIVASNLRSIPETYGASLAGPAPWLLFSIGLCGLAWLGKRTPTASFTFCYLLVMLYWPFEMQRFAVPVLPFLYLGMCALLPRRRLLVGLICLLEVVSGLNDLSPGPGLPSSSQLPASAGVACEGMILGRMTYAQSALDLRQKEWAWDEGLLDRQIKIVVLIPPNLFLEPEFQRRSWYQKLGVGVFEFAPNQRQKRGMLYHIAARQALEQQRAGNAIWLFARAEREFPEQASILAGMARAFWLQGKLPQAREQVRRALQLDPGNEEANGLQNLL